jgi:hypothetical protein
VQEILKKQLTATGSKDSPGKVIACKRNLYTKAWTEKINNWLFSLFIPAGNCRLTKW